MKDMNNLQDQLRRLPKDILRNRKLLFLAVVILAYGFIAVRINILSSAQPNQGAVSASGAALSQPHIDQTTVNKIQQLQNNSVNVQALFNQARQNPFQE